MTNKKITPDMVLKTLSDKPKIQADIARELECYRSTPAKHLKRLEYEGVAKQTPDGWIRAEGCKARIKLPLITPHISPEQIIADVMAGNDITDIKEAIEMHEHHLRQAIQNIVDNTFSYDEDEGETKDDALMDYDLIQDELISADTNIKVIQYLKAALRDG